MYDLRCVEDAMGDVAAKARSYRGTTPMLAFRMFWIIVTEWSAENENIWDDDGDLHYIVNDAIEEIRDLVSADGLSETELEGIHSTLLALVKEESRENDYMTELAPIAAEMAKIAAMRTKADDVFACKLAVIRNDPYGYHSYQSDRFKCLQLSMITRFDGEGAADKFINANLEVREFRRIAADKAKEAKNWERLLSLACEGAESGRFASEWHKEMLEAYINLGDKENIIKMTEYLAFNEDFSKYYPMLKEQFDEMRWKEYFPKLCKKAQEKKHWFDLITTERMEPEIMQECRKNPYLVFSLYGYLGNEAYRAELAGLFEKALTDRAARVASRKEYAELREKIETFKTACGSEPAERLRESLLKTYKRKPAFCQEISKPLGSI